jgi:tetratricopeptide (TPR) repeat protein
MAFVVALPSWLLEKYAIFLYIALVSLYCLRKYHQAIQQRVQLRTEVLAIIREATGVNGREPHRILPHAIPYLFATMLAGACFVALQQDWSEQLARNLGRFAGAAIEAMALGVFLLSAMRRFAVQRSARGLVQLVRKAAYDDALKGSHRLLGLFPRSARFQFLHGTALLFAGKLAEAEQTLRRGLTTSRIAVRRIGETQARQAGSDQRQMLTNLGHVLLRSNRIREAARAFEGTIKLLSVDWSGCAGLAEVALKENQPGRALTLSDQAIELRKKHSGTPDADRHTLAYMWTSRAQALAKLGRIEEAAASLDRADQASDPRFIPGLAGTLWRAGVALVEMEREDAAIRRFERAKEIDPEGLYGTLSASALRDLRIRR